MLYLDGLESVADPTVPEPQADLPAPPRPLWQRLLLAALKLTLSLGLMAFVLRDTSLSALWQTFRRVQPLWVLAAMSMHGFMVAVSVWRWHLLLEAQHVRIPARRLTESF